MRREESMSQRRYATSTTPVVSTSVRAEICLYRITHYVNVDKSVNNENTNSNTLTYTLIHSLLTCKLQT